MEVFDFRHGVTNLFVIRGGAGFLHGFHGDVHAVIGTGGELVRCVAVFLREIFHESLGALAILIRGPHSRGIHIVRRSAGLLHEAGRYETIVPQDRLIHSHFSHLAENQRAFLVVAGDDDAVRLPIVDLRHLGREVVVAVSEGFGGQDFYALVLERALKDMVRRYLVLVVIRIQDDAIFIPQKLVGLLYGLGNVRRLGAGISENIIADVRDAFRRYRGAQGGHLGLLKNRACRFHFARERRPDDDRRLAIDELLRRADGLLGGALGVDGLQVDGEIALPVDFLDGQHGALLLPQAVSRRAAGEGCDETDLRRARGAGGNGRLRATTAATGQANGHRGNQCCHTDGFDEFSCIHDVPPEGEAEPLRPPNVLFSFRFSVRRGERNRMSQARDSMTCQKCKHDVLL